jgi:hypothetical protein
MQTRIHGRATTKNVDFQTTVDMRMAKMNEIFQKLIADKSKPPAQFLRSSPRNWTSIIADPYVHWSFLPEALAELKASKVLWDQPETKGADLP